MYRLVFLGPIVLGIVGVFLFPEGRKFIGFIVGVFFGYLFPRFYIGRLIAVRKVKFNDQLIDAIMIMSSSFRGGLSLIQAFESVADEMPEPPRVSLGWF